MIVLDVSLTKPGFAAGCFNISVLSLKSNKSVENATTQSTTHNNFTKDSNQENNENDLREPVAIGLLRVMHKSFFYLS